MPGLLILWPRAPASGFDVALMAAMNVQQPVLIIEAPSVVASGMAPPDNLIP